MGRKKGRRRTKRSGRNARRRRPGETDADYDKRMRRLDSQREAMARKRARDRAAAAGEPVPDKRKRRRGPGEVEQAIKRAAETAEDRPAEIEPVQAPELVEGADPEQPWKGTSYDPDLHVGKVEPECKQDHRIEHQARQQERLERRRQRLEQTYRRVRNTPESDLIQVPHLMIWARARDVNTEAERQAPNSPNSSVTSSTPKTVVQPATWERSQGVNGGTSGPGDVNKGEEGALSPLLPLVNISPPARKPKTTPALTKVGAGLTFTHIRDVHETEMEVNKPPPTPPLTSPARNPPQPLTVALAAELLTVASWVVQARALQRQREGATSPLVLLYDEQERLAVISALHRCAHQERYRLAEDQPVDDAGPGFWLFSGLLQRCIHVFCVELLELGIAEIAAWISDANPIVAHPVGFCVRTGREIAALYEHHASADIRAGTLTLLTDERMTLDDRFQAFRAGKLP